MTIKDQKYGGNWTIIKLDVVREYLDAYFRVMKNQNFQFCYIDAFAGSGLNETRVGDIEGSALQALDFPFDRFIFIEKDRAYLDALRGRIMQDEKNHVKNINYHFGDCNEILSVIHKTPWEQNFWRGVIFLDPYAMNLDYESLHAISMTGVFDVWYLFPISAMIRCLRKDGNIDPKTEAAISRLLGTDAWRDDLYIIDPQLSLFGDEKEIRVTLQNVVQYVIKRIKNTFQSVLEQPIVLHNKTGSVLFLLCFACSSKSKKAQRISVDIAKSLARKVIQREVDYDGNKIKDRVDGEHVEPGDWMYKDF